MALWQFRQLNPNETSGTSPAEDNFAQEERADFDILVRESIQNPIDARAGMAPVEVSFSWRDLPKSSVFLSDLITPEFADQLKAAGVPAEVPKVVPLLIIEDHGTTGLSGTFTNSDVEGDGENWNAFWFREGEGAKPSKANGGAGQGKLTMYVASKLRTLVAITKRIQDGKSLIFGSARFRRNYVIDQKRYARDARWCQTADPMKLATPIESEQTLLSYQKELSIERSSNFGTSFIIPLPNRDINPPNVIKAVINEFYLPILRGKLKVFVQDTEISSNTINKLAAELEQFLRMPPTFREFLNQIGATNSELIPNIVFADTWGRETKITEDQICSGNLATVRSTFELGGIVVAKFPIVVHPVNEPKQVGSFQVFIQLVDGDGPSMELYVRQDLSIDKERWLRSRLMPAKALTLIDDDNLSKFLAAAEEPTHREWNGARPKLTLNYKNASATLRLVRQAANRFLELVAPPPAKDSVVLSSFFPDFGAPVGTTSAKPKQKKIAEDFLPPEVKVPVANERRVELIAEDTGAIIRPAQTVHADFKPLRCSLELAYGTEMGDSFSQWDAADFYLSLKENFIELSSVEEVEARENFASFILISPTSYVRISGFDPQRQLEMRLKYVELEDADDLSN